MMMPWKLKMMKKMSKTLLIYRTAKMMCSETNLKLNIEIFDVHCNDDDVNDDDDWREEDEEYSDDDDMSWKVRRAAAKCLDAVIGTRHEMLMDFYKNVSPALIARFKGEGYFHCVLKAMVGLTIDYKMMFWPLVIHVQSNFVISN